MLRITVVSQTREEVVLKIEGWVSGEDVDLLDQEGTRGMEEAERLLLDLRDVRFIDDAGIALLKRWSGERLMLRGASPFLRVLLATHGLAYQ